MNDFYFDKVIELKITRPDNKFPIIISSTPNGLKPDITLEVNMLPGDLIYGTTVTITNFAVTNAEAVNIRDYTDMEITAGYKYANLAGGSKTITIVSSIFTSYQESPNPDGVTVFMGVVTGRIQNLLTTNPIHISIHEPITVGDLIDVVAMGTTGITDLVTYKKAQRDKDAGILRTFKHIDERFLQDTVQPPNGNKSLQLIGDNGLSITTKLYDILYAYFKSRGFTYVQNIYGNSLTCMLLEKPDQVSPKEGVITISAVSSLSYNATLCTLQAPWNPLIVPGTLVRINARYFNGQQAYNVLGDIMQAAQPPFLTPQELASKTGIYRVLTEKINFSTNQDTNQMTLLLLPCSYSKQADATADTADVLNRLYSNKIQSRDSIDIEIGKKKPAEDTQNIWNQGLKGNYNTKQEVLEKGTTFAQLAIANYSHRDQLWLSKSVYNKSIIVDVLNDGTLIRGSSTNNLGIGVGRSWAWPIILLATYTNYRNGDVSSKVNLDDPDYLPVGTKVIIPVLPDDNQEAINALKPDKELFKTMADYYKPYINSYKTWAKDSIIQLSNMYLLLGGTL